MNSSKVRFALVGTGAIAKHHAKSIEESELTELVAVCSSTAERAKVAQESFGVPAYSDVRQMLQQEQIDAICICTASGQHLDPTLAAAEHGVHVLSEKPLEVSLERADQMIAACRNANVKLGCIFQNRFKPAFVMLKQAIDSGLLGRLLMGNAYIKWFRDENYYSSSSWKGTIKGDGGAALINQGIHTIDLLLAIMGPVESIFGKVKTMVHQIEGEDIGVGLLSFKNGALGTIEGSTAMIPGYPEQLEVFGEKGSILLEGGEIKAWNIEDQDNASEKNQNKDSGASDPMAISHQYHREQIEDFAKAVQEDREPIVNGEEGRKSLEVIMKIYESSKLGQEVKL